MLITNPGTRAPVAQPHADVPLRQGHHELRSLAWENGDKVLVAQPPTADEIDERLGWVAPEGDRETAMRTAADFLGTIAHWLGTSATIESCGLRGFALAILLKPDMFPQASQTGLAKTLGCTKQAISQYVSELRRMSRGVFTSPVCRRPSRKGQLASLAQHRRRGHKIHALKRKTGMDKVIDGICAKK